MSVITIGYIGLGLIGGSIAKTFRKFYPDCKQIAFNRSESARIDSVSDGTINIATDKIDDNFCTCDYIFLCTPVQYNIDYLRMLKPLISDSCIITDVGSVKENIHEAVIAEKMESNFIGGHPMAGSEKTGYSNSSDHLIENCYYAITPTKATTPDSLGRFRDIVLKLGAIPVILDYKEHDYVVAGISHLPHLIAASLVNLVRDNDLESQTMKQIAAGGFKDITRIASSSPEMWEQICMSNPGNISLLLEKYIESLNQIKEELDNHEEGKIFDLFTKSRDYRSSFSDKNLGPIKKTFAVYCDIIDEAGAISTIATILASNNVSIKNIGIIHNREFEEGALKIDFYDDESADKCVSLLTRHHYNIKKRR